MAAAPGDNRLRRRGRHLRSGHECLKMAPVATSEIKKLVLAYSGGLDTSVILRWARDFYHCEVVAYCADVGQAEETLGSRAKSAGDRCEQALSRRPARRVRARLCFSDDARQRRVRELLSSRHFDRAPGNRQAPGRNRARRGRRRGRTWGHGQGQRPGAFRVHLRPPGAGIKSRRTVAPSAMAISRPRRHARVRRRKKIPVPVTAEKPYSMDRNLVHISYEGGILEDPWREPYDDMFRLTASPQSAPDTPEYVEVEYAGGDPVDDKRQAAFSGRADRAR